jgi:hypothetical protein
MQVSSASLTPGVLQLKLHFGMSYGLYWWIFVRLFSSSVISLLSKLSSYYMHTNEMEVTPNKRNTLASLMDDVFVKILCHLPTRSLFY